jgi:predicted Zn-dependent protease
MRQVIPGLLLVLLAAPAWAVDREAAKGYFRQGNGLYDRYQFAQSAAAYTHALEQDSQFVEAYYNRALANEMVDRQKAMEDLRRFAELAAADPGLKYQVAQARARLQILENLPVYPEALQPSHYVPDFADYYWAVAPRSESEKWTTFPIKVALGSAGVLNWAQGTREAFNIWKQMFPLELVAAPEEADIRLEWESSPGGEGHAGEETDWVQIRRVGGELTGRKVAFITVDLSRRWSKDEMRAIILHEMGHALGIKGHSESRGDIMYWQIQEKGRQIAAPVVPYSVFWRSLVSKPSQRDLNTLIRLYNTPGAVVRLE